jgi:LCP family protein required for cell wall assembly
VVSESVQPVAPGEQWKITNTYAVGGPACTVRAVQQLTGLRIDRVIGIDFVGFKAMVDALGGIQVTICQPIIDATLNTVISQAGPQIINGDTALDLVRARKVQGEDSGDIGRIHRQQVVLSSLLRQVISAGTLLNPGKLDGFLQAFVQNTYTDNVTIDDLVTLTASFGSLDPSEVTFFTVPVHDNQDGSDGLLPDTAAATIFTALVNDQPLPGEPPGTPMTVTATAEPGDAESSTEPATTTASDPPIPPDLPTVNAGQPVCA